MPGGLWSGWWSCRSPPQCCCWHVERGQRQLWVRTECLQNQHVLPLLFFCHRLLFVMSIASLPSPRVMVVPVAARSHSPWTQALVHFWEGDPLPCTDPQRETPPPLRLAYLCPVRWNNNQTFVRLKFAVKSFPP